MYVVLTLVFTVYLLFVYKNMHLMTNKLIIFF